MEVPIEETVSEKNARILIGMKRVREEALIFLKDYISSNQNNNGDNENVIDNTENCPNTTDALYLTSPIVINIMRNIVIISDIIENLITIQVDQPPSIEDCLTE